MAPVVVWVKGIPGSGKTYIGNVLRQRGITVFDTDDVMTEAYNSLTNPTRATIRKAAIRLIKSLIRQVRTDLVVVVGTTLIIKSPDYVYFIKILGKDLKKCYQRTVERELAKYSIFADERIASKLANMTTTQKQLYLEYVVFLNAFEPTVPFEFYFGKYNDEFDIEARRGAIIQSQAAIISDICKLAN